MIGFTGTNETANISSGTVNLNASNESVTIIGNNDNGNSNYSGDVFGFSGTGEVANISGGTVNLNGINEFVPINGTTIPATASGAATPSHSTGLTRSRRSPTAR